MRNAKIKRNEFTQLEPKLYQVLANPTRAMPNGHLLAPVLGMVKACTANEAMSLAAQDFGIDNVATVRVFIKVIHELS